MLRSGRDPLGAGFADESGLGAARAGQSFVLLPTGHWLGLDRAMAQRYLNPFRFR